MNTPTQAPTLGSGIKSGIKSGLNKIGIISPVTSTISGIGQVQKALNNFKDRQIQAKNKFIKKQNAEAMKQQKIANTQQKLFEAQNKKLAMEKLKNQKMNDALKQKQGRAYLKQLKSKLEGQYKPYTPQMTPAHGVAGQVGYVPAQPKTPKVDKRQIKQLMQQNKLAKYGFSE